MNRQYRVYQVESREEYGVQSFIFKLNIIDDKGKNRGGWPIFIESFDKDDIAKFPVNSIVNVEFKSNEQI